MFTRWSPSLNLNNCLLYIFRIQTPALCALTAQQNYQESSGVSLLLSVEGLTTVSSGDSTGSHLLMLQSDLLPSMCLKCPRDNRGTATIILSENAMPGGKDTPGTSAFFHIVRLKNNGGISGRKRALMNYPSHVWESNSSSHQGTVCCYLGCCTFSSHALEFSHYNALQTYVHFETPS